MKLTDLIPRLSSGVEDLFPEGVYDLILDISQRDLSYAERCRVARDLSSGTELLLRSKSRFRLLGVLRKGERESLLSALNISYTTPLDVLTNLERVAKNPTDSELLGLFDWFGEPRPKLKHEEDKKERIPFKENIKPAYGLYEYQRKALDKITARFKAGAPRVMLHMPTGSGKTRTAMALVCRFLRENTGGLVIWLADTFELCDQARKEFTRSWQNLGDREVPLCTFMGGIKDADYSSVKNGFVVLTLQTATAALRKEDKTQVEGLTKLAVRKPFVIFDEAHKAMASKYSQVLNRLTILENESRALGLSATPGRTTASSDANTTLVKFFNGEKIKLEVDGYPSAIAYLQHEGYLAKPNFRPVSSEFDFGIFDFLKNNDDPSSVTRANIQKIEEIIANDRERTLLVFQEAVKLVKQGHKRILLFAASVAQAHRLAYAIRFFGQSNHSSVEFEARAVSSGEITTEERHANIDWFLEPTNICETPKILCNYGILTTGFDAPQTSAVLIARPTNSLVLYSQMVGRGLRGPKSAGTSSCEIVTIVDKNLPAFWDVQSAFMNWEDEWK